LFENKFTDASSFKEVLEPLLNLRATALK